MNYLIHTITWAFFLTGLAAAQTAEEKARALMEKFRPCLVVVSVKGSVVTTTAGDALPPKDQERRALGITIAENGMLVVANSAIDSSVGLEGQKAELDDKVTLIVGAKMDFSSIEISYGDGVVLHGKVVKQEAGADVAFILPDAAEAKAANKKFEFVDLTQFASTADAADPVVGLSRAPSAFGYMPILVLGHISGVFRGERVFFMNTAGDAQGMPIFTLDGKIVGLTVMRVVEGKPSGVLATLAASSIQAMAILAK